MVFSMALVSTVLGQELDIENRLQILEKKITVLEEKNSALEEKNSAFGRKFETSKLALTDGLANLVTQNNENILKIIQNINTSISENHPPKPPCPVEKSNVYLIEGECFAFEKKLCNKDGAKAYCASIFGEHLRGRIHEPRSRSIQDAVLSKWNAFSSGNCHWLGINDNQSEGIWRYD